MVTSMTSERDNPRREARGLAAEFGTSAEVMEAFARERSVFSGVILPRNETCDDLHIVIKLFNGYNVGVAAGRRHGRLGGEHHYHQRHADGDRYL